MHVCNLSEISKVSGADGSCPKADTRDKLAPKFVVEDDRQYIPTFILQMTRSLPKTKTSTKQNIYVEPWIQIAHEQGPTGSRYPTRPELSLKYPTRPDTKIENDWVPGN